MSCWVKNQEVLRFMIDCLKAVGTKPEPAEIHACLLFEADRRGHLSHGLNRLELYINSIMKGLCQPNNVPKILKETVSTAWVDANNSLGSTSAHFGMNLAMQKAADTGVGWVAVKGCNHYGIGGYWAEKAANCGMIGIAFTNSSPLLAPTRSKKAVLGTNPIAISAPASGKCGHFYLDMATTVVALGKIEMMRRKGLPLQPGWAQGPDGKETLDPVVAMKDPCLMPLGGSEKTAGHKGFGLSAAVEMFSGILSGANFGHHVPPWGKTKDKPKPPNLGHSFVALDHKCFAPGFKDRVAECINYWRAMDPADPRFPVLAPGDMEKKKAAETDADGALQYVQQQIDSSAALAKKIKVRPLDASSEKPKK